MPSTPVSGAPGAAKAAWDTEAQIRKALRDPAALAYTKPKTNSLPQALVGLLDYKLRRFQAGRTDDVLAGFNLLIAYAAGSLPAPTTATLSSAKQGMRDLAAAEAFLVRFSAAINAAAGSDLSLAEVLALYRTEADLLAPTSLVRFQDRMPVYEMVESISLGDDTADVLVTMQRGLWGSPFSKLFPAQGVPVGPAARAPLERTTKASALVDWLLILGGLDFLSDRIGSVTPPRVRLFTTQFMNENRVKLGKPDNFPAQQAAFDAVFADLEVVFPPDRTGRLLMAPKNPVRLASFVLTEACLFFRLDKDKGFGPFVEPPPLLKYLAYNTQHKRSNTRVEDDLFSWILASAAVAAKRTTLPQFASLKSKLPAGLPAELKKDPRVDNSEHVAVFNQIAGPAFLGDPTNFGLLAQFVLEAEHAAWSAFEENRGNLARFQKLLAHYTALLT